MPNDNNLWLSGVLGGSQVSAAEFEPQRMNSSLLYITGLVNSGDLTLSLASFPLPKVQTAQSAIPFLNGVRKYAGMTMYEDMGCTFHDYVDKQTLATLWAWKLTVHNPATGRKGFKRDYAKTGRIEVYPPGHGTTSMRIYDVYNIWPMVLDAGDVDMGSDEPVRISVQFAIDLVIPRDLTAQAGAGAAAISDVVAQFLKNK